MKGHRPWKSRSQSSPLWLLLRPLVCSPSSAHWVDMPNTAYLASVPDSWQAWLRLRGLCRLLPIPKQSSGPTQESQTGWRTPLPACLSCPPPTKPPQGRHSPPTAPPPLKSRPHIDTHVVLKVFQAGVGGTPVRSDGRMGTGLCVGMDIRKMGPAPYSAHSCQFPGAYQADRDKHHLTLCPWVSLPAGASGKVHRHTELAIAGSSSGQQMLRWKGRKGEFIGGTSMKEKGAGLGRGHREARQTPTTLPSEGLQT